jgi:SPP1 gp7 family putative phage head morphogenesis protein
MATIQQLAARQRNQIGAVDEANLQSIARAYGMMNDRLKGDVDALMLAIQDLDNPTGAEIKRLPQYKRLTRRMNDELDRFESYLEVAIGAAALAAIGMGLAHSAELVKLAGTFTSLDSGAITPLLNYLRQDGPLYARLKLITTGTLDKVIEQIISGVGQGFNPQKIARLIQDAFGGGLTDALRNMRTIQIYSYRDSARANYMASGVVTGWVWYSELDELVCEACAAEHGTVHSLDESLNGHYNCRCTAIPYIEGLSEPEPTGKDWFDNLTEAQQEEFMGKSKLDAYNAGKFEFSQLGRNTPNDVYGEMRTVTPLKDLLGD